MAAWQILARIFSIRYELACAFIRSFADTPSLGESRECNLAARPISLNRQDLIRSRDSPMRTERYEGGRRRICRFICDTDGQTRRIATVLAASLRGMICRNHEQAEEEEFRRLRGNGD